MRASQDPLEKNANLLLAGDDATARFEWATPPQFPAASGPLGWEVDRWAPCDIAVASTKSGLSVNAGLTGIRTTPQHRRAGRVC
jgi:hypothetical protein